MDRKTALVTGASRGLGLTLSRLLAQTGHDLVITARGVDALESVSKSLESYGGSVLSLPGDVSDPEHRRRLIETTASVFGRLDVLINNASTLGTTPLPSMTEYPLDDLEQVLRVNLLAPLGLTQKALPLLIKGHGLVVNISSDAAVGGYPGWGGYGASKAALDLVSQTLANELREAGVGVASVDPGDMRTQMHQDAFPGEDITDRPLPESTLPFWAWLLSQNPLAVSGHRYQAQSDRWEIAA